ncbi:MAG: hypothetical protein R3C11_01820 [Planctomycetaceae bacterium]
MSQTASARWMSWRGLRWNSDLEQLGSIFQFCDRMLQFLTESKTTDQFLKQLLPEMATEFSAQRICLWERTPKWELVTELGRAGSEETDFRQFEETLDRGEACFNAAGAAKSLVVLSKLDREHRWSWLWRGRESTRACSKALLPVPVTFRMQYTCSRMEKFSMQKSSSSRKCSKSFPVCR